MIVKKYRWSKTYEVGEHELIQLFEEKNLSPERWIGDMGEVFEPHAHDQNKRLWCAEGSIEFWINGQKINMLAGDALDIPANISHSATVGFMGCVCYEQFSMTKS